jgi:DNA (cytosine-5)-methyltransferase 1
MAGFEPIAAQEMESSSVETYRYNHGNIVVAGDIRLQETKKKLIQFAREREPEITVVAGGPPCQGFSMAGWFKSEDARNDLFRDFLEIVDVLEPKHVVMENVQGLIWMKKGQILETILEEFRKRDLRTECRVLKAEEFGVPQLRRRVFIIGSRGTAPRYPSPLYGQSSLDRAPPFTVYDAMSDLAAIDSGEMREEMPYQVETKTDYQRWCRGIIPAEQLVLSRSLPWVES